jgi:hypothetical protein
MKMRSMSATPTVLETRSNPKWCAAQPLTRMAMMSPARPGVRARSRERPERSRRAGNLVWRGVVQPVYMPSYATLVA